MSWFERDHCYTKHWSEERLKDSSRIIPVKTVLTPCQLFGATSQIRPNKNSDQNDSDSDSEIDVDTCDENPNTIGSSSWHCADQKARMQMNECERHAIATANKSFALHDQELVWEDTINKSSWGIMEMKLFNRVVSILQSEKMARLAYKGNSDEIVLRRLSVDRSAARLRSALTSVGWSLKLTQWLHLLLIEKLPTTLLSIYLDIMQTLRSMVPALVERMIMPSRDTGTGASERLGILLKRPWDPAVTAVVSNMKQQMNLGHSILFIVVQCTVMQSSMPVTSRRLRFWNSLLSQIGKVIQTGSTSDETDNMAEKLKWSVHDLAGQTLNNIRKRIRELSAKHPTRKIVLLGWHTASLLNCHACLKEKVAAVVCLGFPLYTMFGERGTIDDVLCDITTPMLFVVGDRAMSCRVSDLEDVRETSFTEAMTSLMVVNGADDWLRVSDNTKRQCAVTQSMADRKILECICEFLHTIFATEQADRTEGGVCRKKSSSFMGDEHLAKRLKFGHERGNTPERMLTGKRHHSYTEFADTQAKRHRSSSPMSRHYPSSSSQLDDFLINQNDEGVSGQLHGLSFNLQTGSISGLTAMPGAHGDEVQRSYGKGHDRLEGRDAAGGSSRSITIDLTKDPNAQLSSALSRRKSQLLQPTEKQTEAAIAAILGGDKSDDAATSHTAVMSPSADLRRFAKPTPTESDPPAVSLPAPQPVKSGMHSGSLTLNLGASNPMASINLIKPDPPTSRKMVNQGPVAFSRSQSFSVDQSRSVLASRSRRDDRETQQATAILEQLTSNLDTGVGSRSPSPDQFLTSTGKKMQGMSSNVRRRSSFDSIGARTTTTRTPTTKGRSRVYKQKSRPLNPTTTPAPASVSLSKSKPSVVRYVLTSSGLSGIISSASGTTNKVTLVQEAGPTVSPQMSRGSKPRPIPLVFSPSARKPVTMATSGSVRAPSSTMRVVSRDVSKQPTSTQSSTPLVDLMLGSAASSLAKSSKVGVKIPPGSQVPGRSAVIKLDGVSTRKEMQTVTISRPIAKPLQHGEGGPVVFLPDNALQKKTQIVRSGATGVSTGTKFLSIARPRAVSTGAPDAKNAAPVARTKSDGVVENQLGSGVRMPALVLTKLQVDSLESSTSQAGTSNRSDK
uniref:KAT8 regulatory NSL complex subunit 3-like n=1 Tax=Phallusia mammillata TaxID=59560 RepID=A0A6F9DEZ5_9ASCI|nr:KAT8 regulatory NSL complex subunit 3-like [Phallusia mammillata]